jgi:two-component system OmpR family response regulator
LVIEDDAEIGRLISRYLRNAGFRVSTLGDARNVARMLEDSRIDLIVLDLMLPGEDGLTLCRRLRGRSNVPIIMVTAKGEEIDRIIGLEMGADDYLCKPFNPRELIARIRAVLRRASDAERPAEQRVQALLFRGWRLDCAIRELRNPDGVKVILTGAEFDLLQALCERAGRVLSRERLLDLTHGRVAGPNDRSIDVLISRLRRKIEPNLHDPEFIKTVRSGGYLFTPVVERS